MKIEDEIKQKKFRNEFIKSEINLSFTSAWLEGRRTQILKPFGISIQQFNLLRILRGQHPKASPLKLLTDRMIDRMSNTSRLVEKLRQKGLVRREICEKNRRQVDIVITEKGLQLIEESSKVIENDITTQTNLTEQEAILLNTLLDKMRG